MRFGSLPPSLTTQAGADLAATGAFVDPLQAARARHSVVRDVPNLGPAPAVTGLGSITSLDGAFTAAAMSSALMTRMSGVAGVTDFDIDGAQRGLAAHLVAPGQRRSTPSWPVPR